MDKAVLQYGMNSQFCRSSLESRFSPFLPQRKFGKSIKKKGLYQDLVDFSASPPPSYTGFEELQLNNVKIKLV